MYQKLSVTYYACDSSTNIRNFSPVVRYVTLLSYCLATQYYAQEIASKDLAQTMFLLIYFPAIAVRIPAATKNN